MYHHFRHRTSIMALMFSIKLKFCTLPTQKFTVQCFLALEGEAFTLSWHILIWPQQCCLKRWLLNASLFYISIAPQPRHIRLMCSLLRSYYMLLCSGTSKYQQFHSDTGRRFALAGIPTKCARWSINMLHMPCPKICAVLMTWFFRYVITWSHGHLTSPPVVGKANTL